MTSSGATLVLPCGTGKTVVAAHVIADGIGGPTHRVIVFVPTIALLAQTIDRITVTVPDRHMIAVCSRTAVDPGSGGTEAAAARDAHLADDVPVTTDADILAGMLHRPGPAVVVATYASSPAVAATGASWDLVVCDEAHRTAGLTDKVWATPLHDDEIPARRRLFMTATPWQVVMPDNMSDEVADTDMEIVSMDQVSLYGPLVQPLTFADAIRQGWLSDYEIAVIAVSSRDAMAHLRAARTDTNPLNVQAAAAQIAVMHATATRPHLRSILAFHNRVEQSRRWCDQWDAIGRLPTAPRRIRAMHIDGTAPAAWRQQCLKSLASPDDALIIVSNCQVFSEGVDVPALDAVVFAAPRNSGPDIVQAVGRTLRPHPDGADRRALVILPVIDYADDLTDLDTAIARSGFVAAWQVLAALGEQDEVLHRSVARWRTGDGTGIGDGDCSPRLLIDTSMIDESTALAFTLRVIDRTRSSHIHTAQLLAEHVARGGAVRLRRKDTVRGFPLGARIAAAREAYRDGRMHPKVAELFTRIPGFSWAIATSAPSVGPDRRIDMIAAHIERTGVPSVNRWETHTDKETGIRFKVGEWVHDYKWRRTLTDEQSARLVALLA